MAAIAVILLRAAISSLPLKSGGMGRGSRPPAAAGVLEPDGVFAFTTETHERAGVVLGEKLRYAHSADHVRGALDAAGLSAACVCVRLTAHGGRRPGPRAGGRGGALGSLLLPLSGHSGHGRACCWLDPVANDPSRTFGLFTIEAGRAVSHSPPGRKVLAFRPWTRDALLCIMMSSAPETACRDNRANAPGSRPSYGRFCCISLIHRL